MRVEAAETLQEGCRRLGRDNVLGRRIVDVVQDDVMADSSARPPETMQDVYGHCRNGSSAREIEIKAGFEGILRESRRNEDELRGHCVQSKLGLYILSFNGAALTIAFSCAPRLGIRDVGGGRGKDGGQ